uniref:Uncharacterized protein TCIL3000_11_7420 n=1 Tax=Trypanosoma congolense (strain IL3000) TaxID=1068625 RepID=G0V0Y8_TRYCI|nr:unnamed protein product [Trypanosoma congolense IL3000]
MPALAFRFALLAVRQLSKPIVSRTVKRAHSGSSLTRTICLQLGHLSAAISSVATKWSVEDKHTPCTTTSPDSNSTAAKDSSPSGKPSAGARSVVMAPRVRSLLGSSAAIGGRVGSSGRILFSSRPMRTAWQTFREGYAASLSEEHLVNAGAQLLVELIVYLILAAVLYAEITSAAEAYERKEKRLLQRIDALEQKVNEIVTTSKHVDVSTIEVPPHVDTPRRLSWVIHKVNSATKKLLGIE